MTTADPQDHALPRTGAEPLNRLFPALHLLAGTAPRNFATPEGAK
ncbi:hypothetical protein [Paracoccus sp. Z118]|nr:hypothetical protein [Paracoccus sp. Z118]